MAHSKAGWVEPGVAASGWVLLSSILASGMVFIDGTALSVALPAMQAALGATGTDLLWVTSGFSLPLAALLLFGGAVGDAFGRKRIFTLGVVTFSVASLACGLAPTMSALIGARVLQGLGGAFMVPGALAMISTFYGPAERGRAIGTWSACSVIATALGPVLGGLLARAGFWRWVFFINLPLAGWALCILFLKVPEDRPLRTRVDWWGAVSISSGLAGINYALIHFSRTGQADSLGRWLFLLGALAVVCFLLIEQRGVAPLLPLSLFRSRTLVVGTMFGVLFYTAFHGMLFFLPLNLIQVQGYDPALAGLTQLPLMISLVLLSPMAGRMVDRHGPRRPLFAGALLAGVGFWLFSVPGLTGGPSQFVRTYLPGLLFVGAGLGLTAAPMSTTIMGSVGADRLGLASGINSTISRLAGLLSLALLGPFAILNFGHALQANTAGLDLTPQARAQLTGESIKLAEAKSPPGLNQETTVAIQASIKHAFIHTFALLAKVTAVLSWLAAVAILRLPPRVLPECDPGGA